MRDITIHQAGANLGTFNSETHGHPGRMVGEFKLLGYVKGLTGVLEFLVFEGKDHVCLLTPDVGYGFPEITLHDKAILEELNFTPRYEAVVEY